jgi:hypothetical protein
MQTDSSFLQTLQAKEAELSARLEESPLWKQIIGIRSTIQLFKEGEVNGQTVQKPKILSATEAYPIKGSWGAKIIYILNKITSGYVDDIMKQIREYEPGEHTDDEVLYKRVSQNASVLKKLGKIAGVSEGVKVKYYKR